MEQTIAPFVNFLAVVFVLWKFGRQPFRDFLAQRHDSVGEAILGAEKAAEEARVSLDHWQKKWNGASQEVAQLMDDAKARIQTLRKNTLAQAEHNVERIQKESRLIGESEAARAKAGLKSELAHKSIMAARGYVAAEITDADQKALVSDYLTKVGNGSAR